MNKGMRNHINKPVLSFLAFSLGLWLIGFPLAAAFITEFSAWFNYVVLGAILLPLLLVGVILLRLVAWFYVYAFWSIQVIVAVALMLALSAFIVIVATQQETIINPRVITVTIPALRLDTILDEEPGRVPTSIFVISGGLLAVSLLLYLALRHIRQKLTESAPPPVVAAPTAPAVPTPKPLTYLQDRQPRP